MSVMTGVEGELLPEFMGANDWVTGIILACFLMMAYALAVGKNFLLQWMHDFFLTRERSSIFNQETAGDVHCRFFLLLQTCLLVAVLLCHRQYAEASPFGIPLSLLVCVSLLFAFGLGKVCLYGVVDWIFFNNSKNALWVESYLFVYALSGIFLFPLVLLVVYLGLPPMATAIYCLILFVFANLLLVYKCFSIFFNKNYGVFYLIVYFCTLEILPVLVLGKGMGLINNIKI